MAVSKGVWISRIALEGLGPLDQGELDFKRFNLIFGHNETGKTYLVEFLIRSLFRHAVDWKLRPDQGSGKVYVSGLQPEPVAFSPDTEAKLEDYWLEREAGLPTNMSRLLVVRGGELDLAEGAAAGVNRKVLKSALSGEELIDELLAGIQATVQEAEFIEGEILGANRGELKQRQELKEELKKIKRLHEQVEQRLSGAKIEQLRQRQARLQAQIQVMERAKSHKAFQLEGKLRELDSRLNELSEETIHTIRQALHDRAQLELDRDRMTERIEEARNQSRNFEWLQQAVEVWQSWQLEDVSKPAIWQLIAGASAVLAGAVLAVAGPLTAGADNPILWIAAAAALMLIGLGFLVWIALRASQWEASAPVSAEREAVSQEYAKRFEAPMAGLADLRLRLEAEREAQTLLDHLVNDLEQLEDKIRSKEDAIRAGFRALPTNVDDEHDWEAKLERIMADRQSVSESHRQTELALERLAVPADRRRDEPVDVEFSPDELRRLERELESVTDELAAAQQDLEGLKGEVIRFTGNDTTDTWERILANLWQKREEVEEDYRRLTSRILAQIAVTSVLNELRSQEDEKIIAGLKDPMVESTVKQITNRYHSISLRGDRLLLSSDTADYQLQDLSTGAQEQVLLALRLGLAQRLAAGRPLFLLLDDAFQHSDWQRRGRLVERVVAIAKQGWQVTYLTMDDHLRDLIQAEAGSTFGDEFSFLQL